MLAHRVGTLGAIVAVMILSVELVGAIAWKHHAAAEPSRYDRSAMRDALERRVERVDGRRARRGMLEHELGAAQRCPPVVPAGVCRRVVLPGNRAHQLHAQDQDRDERT